MIGQAWRWSLAALTRAARRPFTVVLVGVLIVGIPAFFTIVPEALRWSKSLRLAIVGALLILAIAAVLGAIGRDRAWDSLASETERHRRQRRVRALDDTLRALLRAGAKGLPRSFSWTLYLYDETANKLLPYFPERVWNYNDPRVFEPGKGATGKAWRDDRTWVVVGDAVSDGVHGLTDEQQRHFSGCRSVVATSVYWTEQTKFGVLTAISTEEDKSFLGDGPDQAALRELADTVGVVLRHVADVEDLVQGETVATEE